MRVSFLIPAYNEAATIGEVLERIAALGLDAQVIVVDDGSTDDTAAIAEAAGATVVRQAKRRQGRGDPHGDRPRRRGDRRDPGRRHGVRPGRGARADRADRARQRRRRLRLAPARGQAAARVTCSGTWSATASSRCSRTCSSTRRSRTWRPATRRSGSTCSASLDLRENGFGLEPEITGKVCKRKLRIYELPISYYGRTHDEGKKITWRDGFRAIWVLLRVRVAG